MRESVFEPPDISVVAPCFNESLALEELSHRIQQVCDAAGRTYELFLIDDGSTDDTWEVICEIARRNRHVRGVALSRNFGQEVAIHAGLVNAHGELTLIIDADLQDPPELLPEMLKLIESGADVVYGQRRSRPGETWVKKFTASAFYLFFRLIAGVRMPPNSGHFRLMRRRVVDSIKCMPEHSRFFRGIVCWVGFRHAPILFDRPPRVSGNSHWPMTKMSSLAVDAIVAFSMKPLRVAWFLASSFILLSLLFFWVALSGLLQDNASYAMVVGVILFTSSCQLLVFGILGEYVGRIGEQVRRRPLYFVRETTNCDSLDCERY